MLICECQTASQGVRSSTLEQLLIWPNAGAGATAECQQQGCATDDIDFERMMARFDDLEKQEAAAHNGAVAAGLSCHLDALCCLHGLNLFALCYHDFQSAESAMSAHLQTGEPASVSLWE